MQAVIIAAGESKRFWPFNAHTKSLFKIMGKPIIFYTLKSLEKLGIKEAIIVQKNNREVEDFLSEYRFKIKINYVCQKEQKGTADAILCAKKFIKGDFLFLSGHKADVKDYFKNLFSEYKKKKTVVMSLQKISSDEVKKNKYHSAVIKNRKVLKITEECKESECFKVNEVYILTKSFLDVLEKFKNEEKGLITALNNFIRKNEVAFSILKNSLTLKYPWHLFAIRDYIFKNFLKNRISKSVKIGKNVVFNGKVFIGENTIIGNNVVFNGNVYIGDNSQIGDFNVFSENINIEKNFKSGTFLEVKNSIIGEGVRFHGGYLGDSIIGNNCKIGHHITTCNFLLSEKDIKCMGVDTKMRKLGLILGGNSSLGACVCTMPGTVVGNNCKIYPFLKIKGFFEDNKVIKE
ncbi:Bifunctional protein GlmU [bacterium HR34]|nr:Bifunctional protein GlmU [bacterium HR34]